MNVPAQDKQTNWFFEKIKPPCAVNRSNLIPNKFSSGIRISSRTVWPVACEFRIFIVLTSNHVVSEKKRIARRNNKPYKYIKFPRILQKIGVALMRIHKIDLFLRTISQTHTQSLHSPLPLHAFVSRMCRYLEFVWRNQKNQIVRPMAASRAPCAHWQFDRVFLWIESDKRRHNINIGKTKKTS